MKKEILISGIGWISSGIISAGVYYLKTSIISSTGNNAGLLYLGIFVIFVGAALLAENKKIGRMMEEIKKRQAKAKL
ncbi:MAG: hypothetical protein KGH67_03720 [Candidatus Micrarchaeota archaeon]|nr:hypothetical protein [Candidatus Micrarchaeota archaeon]MDE1859611.1 hypothetical protein [Candidatus Micrarchaeota archaeon]